MDDENIAECIQQGLQALEDRDLYDHKEEPAPNEFAFKMLVLGVLLASGWKCKSEFRVRKESGGTGYVDILAIREEEIWYLELKYYSLAYWFASPAGYVARDAKLFEKRVNARDRVYQWDQLESVRKLEQLFLQQGIDDTDLKTLEPKQYKKLKNSVAVALEVLVERAKKQVRNYLSSEARKCVIIGVGPSCYVHIVE